MDAEDLIQRIEKRIDEAESLILKRLNSQDARLDELCGFVNELRGILAFIERDPTFRALFGSLQLNARR